MRKTISGLVAAIAVMSAAPAMACGVGLFDTACSPCAQSYVSPCAPPVYVAPVAAYSGCNTGCGGWARERLADPEQQYYYVNQGPTYTGPGNWAPRRTYQEGYVSGPDGYRSRPYYGYDRGYRARPHFRPWRAHRDYGYSARPSVRYGYAPRHSYAPRYSLPPRAYGGHYSMRYGAPVGAPHRYGHRHERAPRRYY
jgi:hypothetical protein